MHLDAQRERGHVEQQHVLHFAGQNTALNGGTDGHYFVGVNAFAEGFLPKNFSTSS